LTVKRLEAQDWAESWKRHFKPLEIGKHLLVQPSWSRRRPRPNQALVVLDPGLSFGTGQHPTTEFCLHQLVACRPSGRQASLLDLRTGAGILAIAGVKLGYKPVVPIDNDPVAVQTARANAAVNRVTGKLRIQKRDVTRLSGSQSFDLICANLTAELLQSAASHILGQLNPGGALVLAGILDTQFEDVRKTYEQTGLKLVASERNREWRSGRFEPRR
jgi:ribosomal protein L11 methyltransferase